jgi:L-alanine-DL-glutamate epimerase-like enolase superfamily enzyme
MQCQLHGTPLHKCHDAMRRRALLPLGNEFGRHHWQDAPMTRNDTPSVEGVDIAAYTIPTDAPEGDGTYTWHSTTLVVAEVSAGGMCGLGYTSVDAATARRMGDLLAPIVMGRDAMDVPGALAAMVHAIRNLGRRGVCSMAIAGLDTALWDLKVRQLDLPLCLLLGRVRDAVPVYGSGTFTTYSKDSTLDKMPSGR